MPSIDSKIRTQEDGTESLKHDTKNIQFEFIRYPNNKLVLAIGDKETGEVVELHGAEIKTLQTVLDVMS